MEKIAEGNRLIQDYMGKKTTTSESDFTKSWDELKPVIDKCFKELKVLGIDRRAGWNPSHGYAPNLFSLGLDCTLNQAWESVVFSIKWINEKNKR